jgi:hypothetical protein
MFLWRWVDCNPVLPGMCMLTAWKNGGIVIRDYTASQSSTPKFEFQFILRSVSLSVKYTVPFKVYSHNYAYMWRRSHVTLERQQRQVTFASSCMYYTLVTSISASERPLTVFRETYQLSTCGYALLMVWYLISNGTNLMFLIASRSHVICFFPSPRIKLQCCWKQGLEPGLFFLVSLCRQSHT